LDDDPNVPAKEDWFARGKHMEDYHSSTNQKTGKMIIEIQSIYRI
jgi:hypothetical protein